MASQDSAPSDEEREQFERYMLRALINNATPQDALSEITAGVAVREIEKIWQLEPDRKFWELHGFPCLMLRGGGGIWCGYVGLNQHHPCYQMPYDDINAEVHGGLTFGAMGNGKKRPKGYYWIGFDCGHPFDLIPFEKELFDAPEKFLNSTELKSLANLVAIADKISRALGMESMAERISKQCEYRDVSYVMAEVCRLAKQMYDIELGKRPARRQDLEMTTEG